jgi:hypothetical protein
MTCAAPGDTALSLNISMIKTRSWLASEMSAIAN